MRVFWVCALLGLAVLGSCGSDASVSADDPSAAAETRSSEPAYLGADGAVLDTGLNRVGALTALAGVQELAVSSEGRIVYSSSRGATADWDCCGPNMFTLYTAGSDGEGSAPLWDGTVGVADGHPSWSPEGDAFVFTRRGTVSDAEPAAVEEGVYVYDLVHSELRLLIAGDVPNDFDAPVWLPGGDRIAVSRRGDAERPGEIVVVDVASGEIQATIPGEAPFASSPDGTQLAVSNQGELAVYEFITAQRNAVPGTAPDGPHLALWGADGLLVRLHQGGGDYVWSLVDPTTGSRKDLRHCSETADTPPCPLPLAALPGHPGTEPD